MARVDVSLGAIDLVSTTADLQLHLDSRAQFASSAANADGICDRLTSTVLTAYNTKDLWITRGNDFRLVIRLDVDVEGSDRVRLVRTFAHNLYHAELWQQLHLRASSIEVTCERKGEPCSIILRLSGASVSLSSRLHKLAEGVPSDDIHPPGSVDELSMESVHLYMQVKSQPRTKRRKFDLHLGDPSATATAALDATSEVLRRRGLPDSACSPTGAETDDMLVEALDRDADVYQPAQRECVLLKRAASAGGPPNYTCSTAEYSILDLLDAGLRRSIAAPKRAVKGTSVGEIHDFQYLADVAPAVWSPSYHLAVSRRAVLTPTISRALSGVGIASAHRTTLRTKMEELSRRSRCHEYQDISGLSTSSSAQVPLDRKLWQVAQISLLDPDAARRLGPTVGSACVAADNEFNDHDILDTGSDSNTMLDDIDEDDTLLSAAFDSSPSKRSSYRQLPSFDEPLLNGYTNPGKEITDMNSADSGIEDDVLSICDSIASTTFLPSINSAGDYMHVGRQGRWTDVDTGEKTGLAEEEMLFAN